MLGSQTLYESGDGLDSDETAEYTEKLTKTMAELVSYIVNNVSTMWVDVCVKGLTHDAVVAVDDFAQELQVQIIVKHV